MASCERRVPMLTTLVSCKDAITVTDMIEMRLQGMWLPIQVDRKE
jgi:hypothetical protein